ncbi:MAG: CHAT domain-containing protein [Chloroflexi bacterium]|nr:MAG: CHAT domain-containing protein [Chloroflexota bacterium]
MGERKIKPIKHEVRQRYPYCGLLLFVLCLLPCVAQSQDFRHRSREAIDHGDLQEGLRWAEKALSAARQTGDRQQEAWALDQIGNAYFSLSDWARALEYFQAALTMMREVNDRFGEATAIKDVAITLKYFGQFDEAAELLHQALDIFRELDESNGVMSALDNLGLLYMSLGAHRLALNFYERAFEIAKKNQNAEGIYALLIRIGYFRLELGDPRRALEDFRHALVITEDLNRPLDQAWALMGISNALDQLGQVAAAIEACQRALNLSRQYGDGPGIGSALLRLGYFHLDDDPAVALNYFQHALSVYEQYNLPLNWGMDITLARVYRRQGDPDRAIEHYQRAIDRVESVRRQLSSEQHRATFLGQHQRVYQELVETLMERYERIPGAGDDIRAFATFERAKARAMIEAIVAARLDIEHELGPELRQSERQLNVRIAELQRRLVQPSVTREERHQILQHLSQTEEEFDRLITEIKRHNPHYAALRYPEPLSLEQAQARLDERTALLAYMITDKQVFAFLLTDRAFHAEQLAAAPKVLVARVQNYTDLIAQDDRAGWPIIGRRLYADLVAPLRRHLPPNVHRLIIVPDGILHYLPFETLLVANRPRPAARDPQSHFLLEDFIISYAPSATALAELSASQARLTEIEREDLLALANPQLNTVMLAQRIPGRPAETLRSLYDDEGLQITPLPFSAAEVKAIARYAGSGSQIYTGREASEHRIKTDRLNRFRVTHFATHGLISQRMSARSALVLAPGDEAHEDGFLQAREIYRLKLASDLVVLSACQTARGRILAGEGVQGLAQAFFYAGTPSVVASLWNVNDKGTAVVMEAFYRHLAEGTSKAEALRAAKLELLREGSISTLRCWAPFILIGEADQPVPLHGRPGWLEHGGWFVAITLTLIGLLVRFTRRKRSAVNAAKRRSG